jgi:hypothetical protein
VIDNEDEDEGQAPMNGGEYPIVTMDLNELDDEQGE